MATLDIGIDLGTSNILASDSSCSVMIKEPSVVAVHSETRKVLKIGAEAYTMIGRTPSNIEIIHPLRDGVVCDYRMTEMMIRYLLRQINYNQLLKPRLSICVPSGITEVESQAVVQAALAAGARKVFLIEEPVAAAIGAGLDLAKANGNLLVDIGGGTTDVAVLSFNGIVCKRSLRVAGTEFNDAIVKHVRAHYNLLVGERMAEAVKIEIGSVHMGEGNPETYVKGRDVITGLPKKVLLKRSDLIAPLSDVAEAIVREVQLVLEKTPPELIGDIRDNSMILTGGGALLHGLGQLLANRLNAPARVAENAAESVAIGTARSFKYLNQLTEGFTSAKK